jgi:acyl-coenzyme A thioesterase PaaI-like protein
MKTPNPEFIKRVSEMVSTSPYFELLSMKLVDAGIGYSSLEIDLTQKHFQPFGTVHGGVFSSIIDAAAFSPHFGRFTSGSKIRRPA